MREPCFNTVINWPAISLSILLCAEAPANNEVMNSQSDLTIDPLFTIVTTNAFNDPLAGSHPQQGAKEAPGLWKMLGSDSSCQHQAPEALLVAQAGGERAKLGQHSILSLLCPLLPPLPPLRVCTWVHTLPSASGQRDLYEVTSPPSSVLWLGQLFP